jgi:hypothetical protein
MASSLCTAVSSFCVATVAPLPTWCKSRSNAIDSEVMNSMAVATCPPRWQENVTQCLLTPLLKKQGRAVYSGTCVRSAW